jgi:hypothetical protein
MAHNSRASGITQSTNSTSTCHTYHCPEPARTVRYSKKGTSFYPSINCQGTPIGQDIQLVYNWCQQSNITIKTTIRLKKIGRTKDVNFQNNQTAAKLILIRHDKNDTILSNQHIPISIDQIKNPDLNREYTFQTKIHPDELKNHDNYLKAWLQLPSYINKEGKENSTPWITTPKSIKIEKRENGRIEENYQIIIGY